MEKRYIRLIMVILGISFGIGILPSVWEIFKLKDNLFVNNILVNGIIGALIFLILSVLFVNTIALFVKKTEKQLSELSLSTIVLGSIGIILGLIIGVLVSIPLFRTKVPFANDVLPASIMIALGYLGFKLTTNRSDEFLKAWKKPKEEEDSSVLDRKAGDSFRKYKILDTSVIIDGRVYDIAKTGFIEGTLLIPKFVLYELQYIADSGDSLKRVRGRRGLDILNDLQKEEGISVEMYEGDFEDISEVDTKLIKLAKMLDGVVVTNDYNLNKVAEFQNVPVMNINELANAVKPVVIPGETMNVMVVKAGTERQQGVAYLDDGTMVVVEDGQYHMNKHLPVVVTSALQTAAGRMIFAKPVHSQKGIEEELEDNPEKDISEEINSGKKNRKKNR